MKFEPHHKVRLFDIIKELNPARKELYVHYKQLTAKKLGVKLYKCDPYCSFQRGTNERMNGIVRRFIPKGYLLKTISQIYLDNISFEINYNRIITMDLLKTPIYKSFILNKFKYYFYTPS